jgi:hypothetical protein
MGIFAPVRVSVIVIVLACVSFTRADVSGDAEIAAPAGPSRIVIRTTRRTAGAIDSLTWNGKEFLDSFDHGRQLQSASNFDAGSAFTPETFNPTEAGSRDDGRGPTSTSKLLSLSAEGNRLETRTRMAFWLRPGEESGGNPAKNTTDLSDHILQKRVTIGLPGLPHVIEYIVTFTVPGGEHHAFAQFEALTGYMPPAFAKFYTYDPAADALATLSDGPGEQSKPIIFATASGDHAMGIWCPGTPSPDYGPLRYGRWRFLPERVVKWNCVFRLRDKAGIKPGDYTFGNYVIVGALDDVKRSMRALHERLASK